MMHSPLRSELFEFLLPAQRFLHVVANDRHQDRWSASQHEHVSPTKTAPNKIVGDRGQKKTEVVSGVHQSPTHSSALFRPVFGNERGSERPFSTDAHSR